MFHFLLTNIGFRLILSTMLISFFGVLWVSSLQVTCPKTSFIHDVDHCRSLNIVGQTVFILFGDYYS